MKVLGRIGHVQVRCLIVSYQAQHSLAQTVPGAIMVIPPLSELFSVLIIFTGASNMPTIGRKRGISPTEMDIDGDPFLVVQVGGHIAPEVVQTRKTGCLLRHKELWNPVMSRLGSGKRR